MALDHHDMDRSMEQVLRIGNYVSFTAFANLIRDGIFRKEKERKENEESTNTKLHTFAYGLQSKFTCDDATC